MLLGEVSSFRGKQSEFPPSSRRENDDVVKTRVLEPFPPRITYDVDI
jgi:hypothetical protein